MFDFLKNKFLNRGRYKTHSEAVIVSCFYNPQNSPYRLLAFQKWYRSIKHLNYRIVECLIGPDAKSQLPNDPNIIQVETNSVLWHKESLLNKAIAELPEKFKYVFWVDADVLFTNDNWLVDSVKKLESGVNIVQPFEYCIHLERNQLKPEYNLKLAKKTAGMTNKELGNNKRLWRSFCANIVDMPQFGNDNEYDRHGHVGFAWGARREVLKSCPLFDRALIGGADHIIAHAAAGQIPHACITKGFTANIDEILEWSRNFHQVVQGQIAYVPGDLYHIWHGDISTRQYLKRIQDFTDQTKKITDRDENGLHVSGDRDRYVRQYFQDREVPYEEGYDFDGFDAGFYEDMGYMIADIVDIFGQQPESDSNLYVETFLPPDQGVSDFQQNDFLPFDQGGVGISDDGQHIITDEMLQGATISGDDTQEFSRPDDQPDFTPSDSLDPNDGGNFS